MVQSVFAPEGRAPPGYGFEGRPRMTTELSDVKLNYIPIADARRMSGLRIVLGAYPIPGPWRES